MKYRNDIDGLRALAVISVILFHLGYFKNGYLGVDVFFVISGYLITGIVYRESINNNFSILKFYERRVRRIIPLVLFSTLVAFLIGLFLMLPSDLEDLSQSIITSNLSVNNILMYITSNDYWGVANDFKPLLHTWSLGIEEQFYLLYPLIFIFCRGKRIRFILPILTILSLLSVLAFLFQDIPSKKFYFIQYRFFELSIGGIASIFFNSSRLNYKNNYYSKILWFSIIILMIILFFPINLSNDIKIIVVTIATTIILVFGDIYFLKNIPYQSIFSNKIIRYIGKISFSIYMWHQIVFAFYRYSFNQEISLVDSFLLLTLTFLISILSFYLVENPFRNKKKFNTKSVFIFVSIFLVLINSSALYVYALGGVIRDVPELNVKFSGSLESFSNSISRPNNFNLRFHELKQYNEKIRDYDKNFLKSDKLKVLVIGNSFGRDFINILLESEFENYIQISYFDSNNLQDDNLSKNKILKNRIIQADKIFFVNGILRNYGDAMDKEYINKIEEVLDINLNFDKTFIVGTKDFGYSNGIHYYKIRNTNLDKLNYRTRLERNVYNNNIKLKSIWKENFIDLIELTSDNNGKVLVFTPNSKFISHDTLHLTRDGARFYSFLLNSRFKLIFN